MGALPETPDTPETPAATPAAGHLILIDGSGFIFRAFHALPALSRPDGTPVNAVLGFSNMLGRFLQNHVGTHLAVIFDAGRTTFRNALYDQYKAHRPEPPPELVPQFALVRDATAAFGVPAIELADFEADDLIASYACAATRAGMRTTVVSSDKDLMQLVNDHVQMHDPIKQKPITAAEVMEKFGVPPALVVEVQALMGDSVDNIPGVPGIGPKNAAQLINEHGTLEAVLAAAPAMKPGKRRDMLIQHAEAARISRKLVELSCDVPLPLPLDALAARDPDRPTLTAWLAAMGFRTTIARLGLDAPSTPEPEPAQLEHPPETPPFGPYECVTTEAALATWIAEATAAGVVAFDTETDNLDAMRANLVGISLATAPTRACYIPLRHQTPPAPPPQLDLKPTRPPRTKATALDLPRPDQDPSTPDPAALNPATSDVADQTPDPAPEPTTPTTATPESPPQLPLPQALALLAPLFADPAVLKIAHNAKYDLMVLARAGLPHVAPTDCTMLISYAQGAGAHAHNLDEISLRNLGHKPISFDTVTGTGRNRIPFAHVPLDRATNYAAEDADIALRLWHLLRPRLRPARALALYEHQERRLLPVLMAMEQAGVKIDEPELRRMSADFAARMADMEIEIHALAGRPFNLGSSKVLGEILFDDMKLPGGKRMPSGIWGTDVSVLQSLADAGHELPARIIDWRQLSKLRSTYTEALVTQINPDTNRVHTSFAQAITTTGRLSSTDPNLQNIPIRTEEGARIRKAFVAEPGHLLVSADYSQIELRLLAHAADIPPLREAFATGQDIHARTASEVFGVPMAAMDPATRRRAKAINFGIIYGISAFGLARQLAIDPAEARAYIDAYFTRYPGIRDYMARTKDEARQHGYVLTPFGRRCWVPGITDKSGPRRAYAERQAINAPLQGGAADIIKRAMVRLPQALRSAGLQARLLLQVHDELLFEAPEPEAQATADLAQTIMESAAHLTVPLQVETGIGPTWAAAH